TRPRGNPVSAWKTRAGSFTPGGPPRDRAGCLRPGRAECNRVPWGRRGQPADRSATLLLELPLVVALPELRRRPGLVPFDADGFEALHGAENIQAPGDVLWRQVNILQRHALQRSQVGDFGVVNPQQPQRHALEVSQARVTHLRFIQQEARQVLAVLEVG